MSAKVDVLAVLDRLTEGAWGPELDVQCKQARAAIAELIAAGQEYDAARAEMADTSGYVFPIGSGRLLKAKQRRAAALAAVTAQRREVSDG